MNFFDKQIRSVPRIRSIARIRSVPEVDTPDSIASISTAVRPNNTNSIDDNSTPNSPKSTPKDKFVVTVGAIVYLMFPTLINGTFKLFDCRTVGNGRWLHADMEESCDGDRYQLLMPLLGISQLLLYVCGLPFMVLWFLIRNKRRLHTHVVQSRYGLFFAGYKDNRFYWEIVLSLRKIIVVGLGVFGPNLGPVRQSVVALLILFIFIILEIMGDPFQEPTIRHKILAKLELTTLVVLFLTMWGGLMIFSSAEVNDMVSVEFLTVCVVLMTAMMMAWLVYQLLRQCVHEKAADVADLRLKALKLRRRISRIAHRRSTQGEKKNDDDGELGTGDGEGYTTKIEMIEWSNNPMANVSALVDSADTGTDITGTGHL
jgi:hypothetical protein